MSCDVTLLPSTAVIDHPGIIGHIARAPRGRQKQKYTNIINKVTY